MENYKLLIDEANEVQYEIVEELNESTGKSEKNYYIKGIFSTPDRKNRNGRIYSRSLWENAIAKWHRRVKENPKFALGEYQHPSRFEPDPMKAVMKIVELKLEDGYVKGKAKILNNDSNPQIAQLKTLIDEGLKIGVSSRGTGRLKGSIVEEFELSCYDIVPDPSDWNAMLDGITESVEKPLIYESSRDTWVCNENGCYLKESLPKIKINPFKPRDYYLDKLYESKSERELQILKQLFEKSEYAKLKDEEPSPEEKEKEKEELRNKEDKEKELSKEPEEPKEPGEPKVPEKPKEKENNDKEDKEKKKLEEARPTRISNIFLDMDKCKEFKLIDFRGSVSGFTAFIRYKDGNLYRFDVRPAKNEEML
jgi:hypothetical protein